MARKTFISYKYNDAVEGKPNNLRDRIINKLGADSRFYCGENGYSKDLTSYSADYIKTKLKDMIRDISVAIVILSPNMKLSNWMNWEITYSLMEITRENRKSLTNGIVCVVQKQPTYYGLTDGYSWMKNWRDEWDLNKCFDLIRLNQNNKRTYSSNLLSPNYIDTVTEDSFLRNSDKYIEEAYEKAKPNAYYIKKREVLGNVYSTP